MEEIVVQQRITVATPEDVQAVRSEMTAAVTGVLAQMATLPQAGDLAQVQSAVGGIDARLSMECVDIRSLIADLSARVAVLETPSEDPPAEPEAPEEPEEPPAPDPPDEPTVPQSSSPHANFEQRIARSDVFISDGMRTPESAVRPGRRQYNASQYAPQYPADQWVVYDAEAEACRFVLPPQRESIDQMWFGLGMHGVTPMQACIVAEFLFPRPWATFANQVSPQGIAGHKFLNVRARKDKIWFEPGALYQANGMTRMSRVRGYASLGPGGVRGPFTVDGVSYDSDAMGPIQGNVWVPPDTWFRTLIVVDHRAEVHTRTNAAGVSRQVQDVYCSYYIQIADGEPVPVLIDVPQEVPVGVYPDHFDVEMNSSQQRSSDQWIYFLVRNVSVHHNVADPLSLML